MSQVKKTLCITATEADALRDFWKPQLINRHPDPQNPDMEYCENNPKYVQLIPYVTVVLADPPQGSQKKTEYKILYYRRSKGGGESKLHDLYSIGFGGHVEGRLAAAVDRATSPQTLAGIPDNVMSVMAAEIKKLMYSPELLIAALVENVAMEIKEELNVELDWAQLDRISRQLELRTQKKELIWLHNPDTPENANNYHLGIPVTVFLSNQQGIVGGENEIDDLSSGTLYEILTKNLLLEPWSLEVIKRMLATTSVE